MDFETARFRQRSQLPLGIMGVCYPIWYTCTIVITCQFHSLRHGYRNHICDCWQSLTSILCAVLSRFKCCQKMQKKWLLDFEVKQALKISKARSPQRNKNQEKEGGEGLAQERALTDEDRANVRSYSVLMPLASRSVRKLDELLVKAVTEDSRSTGIGSYGGHIARERKLPGPLNGKEVYEQGNGYVTSPFYVKLKKKKVRAAIEDPDELNPAWDKNFVNDHQGREKAAKSEKDDQYLHLKLEMHSFLTRQCANPDVTPVSFPAAELSAPDRRGFPKLLPEEVLDEWTDMLAELSKIASAVASSDLMEIASWQKPPSAAVDILGFLAALLGVNPDWSTMKKVLLRNIPALLNFIQRVSLVYSLQFTPPPTP